MSVGFGPSSPEVAACKPIKTPVVVDHTQKKCPASTYCGNPAWEKLVDQKTCEPVVDPKQISDPYTGKMMSVCTLKKVAKVTAATPKKPDT